MHHTTRRRLHMGCGEPLCCSARRFRELGRRPGGKVAGRKRAYFGNGGRAYR